MAAKMPMGGTYTRTGFIHNLPSRVHAYEAYVQAIDQALAAVAVAFVERVHQKALLNLEGGMLQKRTGTLLKSQWRKVAYVPGQGWVLSWGNSDPVAVIQHEGRPGPWTIRPRGKGNAYTDIRGVPHPGADVLVFEKGGELVFTKRVTHPGLRPRPFLLAPLIEEAALFGPVIGLKVQAAVKAAKVSGVPRVSGL